jgi:antitoxin FitA
MSQLVVRGLEETVTVGLRRRAKRHGRSMEEEVREILRNAARSEPGALPLLGSRLAARFAGVGLDRDIPEWPGDSALPIDPNSKGTI